MDTSAGSVQVEGGKVSWSVVFSPLRHGGH